MAKNGLTYKLVRDNIPNIIRSQGSETKTRTISDPQKKEQALYKKLKEEIQELQQAQDDNISEEIADILEVLGALVDLKDLDNNDIFKILEDKRKERGSFSKFIELQGKW